MDRYALRLGRLYLVRRLRPQSQGKIYSFGIILSGVKVIKLREVFHICSSVSNAQNNALSFQLDEQNYNVKAIHNWRLNTLENVHIWHIFTVNLMYS